MKKSATKYRKKRRLKKAVRRTVGALFMISAIIVAAIPFPDAAAADPAAPPTYSYPADLTGDYIPIDFANASITSNGTAYTMSKPSSGGWQLDWQFKYYAETMGANGLITEYNSQYSVDEIQLDYRVYSDYVAVKEDDYKKYYNDTAETAEITVYYGDTAQPTKSIKTLGKVYTLSGDPATCVDKQFFIDNFADDYNKYKEAYTNAKLNNDSIKYPYPENIIKTYQDVYKTDDDRMQFFCDQVFGSGTPMTLQIVDKRVYVDGKANSWDKVYAPQLKSIPEATDSISIGGIPYYSDRNGFLARNFAALIGIAKNAFSGVQNVKTLEMAKEISYIGDSAFENSFLESVKLSMGAQIGNRAFAKCSRLANVDLPEGVSMIGAEAFSRSSITKITIPYSVEKIGSGAFSYCTNLANVTITSGGSLTKTIGKYAFFDCLGLTNVDFGTSQITEIGEASFAVDTAVTANMSKFKFPDYIIDGAKLGTCVLGGRSDLTEVTMPSNLGYSVVTAITDDLFTGCTGLECVIFPETCGNVSYGPNLFKQVIKENFYVRGPKEDGHLGIALPRTSTRTALFNTSSHVPYVYNEGGENFYEVSDGTYVLTIDSKGVLTSGERIGTGDIPLLTIPEKVGTTAVTGIKEGCFAPGEKGTLDYIKVLEVKDSSMTTIGNNVFKGALKLEKIIIGNSVTTIGSGAFSECPVLTTAELGSGITSIGNEAFKDSKKLENITFASPANGTVSFPLENIGTDAFSTGGEKLTITGDAAADYGPFVWSMQPDNYMNKEDGVRVCYKTPSPSNLTIILDNQNNLPTLVDYPHYEDLKDLTLYNDLISRYEAGSSITPVEEALVKSTLNINVPSGVKSIDARGYFSNASKKVEGVEPYSNSNSISAYFGSMRYKNQYQSHGLFNGFFGDIDGADGGKREYSTGDGNEKEDIGNDRIKSITLSTVEYLPNGCFNSCEGLETVYLGSSINDIVINPLDDLKDPGKPPFEGCTALTSIACGNNNFIGENGILYQNLANDNKYLIECFASRGKVGSSTISLNNDPLLAKVSQISPAAFRYCNNITSVDFTGANKFDEIPDECFSKSVLLTEIDLPANVDTIGDQAFADTGTYTKVIVRGKEVSLGKDAFENVAQPYLVSYKDSGVRKAAKKQGVNVEQTIDNMYTVKFYTYDGATLIKSVQVEEGDTADAPEDSDVPARESYTFTGWSRSLKNISEDMFVLAVYTPNAGVTPGVTPGTTPGVTPGVTRGVTPGVTNKVTPTPSPSVSPTASATQYQLTVVYGSGSGKYASGTTVIINAIEPPAGKVFDKWVTATTGVTIASATSMATTVKTTTSDATITATYKNTGSASGNSVNKVSSSKSGGATEVNSGNSNTKVDITKPGISNTDKAYASVSGSSDNFIIKISESDEAANEVATALSTQYSDMNPIKYFAMDIALYDATGTNKIENTDGLSVNITMPVPDALVQYAGNNKVGVVINGSLNVLNCKFLTIDGIPCISFMANHFSPYTIFVDTANLTQGTLDSTPRTGDGIHPKWFVVIAFACISLILFLKKDKVTNIKVA